MTIDEIARRIDGLAGWNDTVVANMTDLSSALRGLAKLAREVEKPQPPPLAPPRLGSIAFADLKDKIQAELNPGWIQMLAREYKLSAAQFYPPFLAWDEPKKPKYIPGERECEYFALRLKLKLMEWAPTYPAGFVVGSKPGYIPHAWELVVDYELRMYYIDPSPRGYMPDKCRLYPAWDGRVDLVVI